MKTIIVYYSYGNHTRMIAEDIQKKLQCDILEIKLKNDYSSDYQTVVDLTEDNLESKKTPEIEDISISLVEFDKIIIGTPVWWYTITPPIRTFLKNNDFNNKKVYAFATNAGWLGSTFDEIKSIVGDSLQSTLSVQFTTNHEDNKLITSWDEIDEWIQNNNFNKE